MVYPQRWATQSASGSDSGLVSGWVRGQLVGQMVGVSIRETERLKAYLWLTVILIVSDTITHLVSSPAEDWKGKFILSTLEFSDRLQKPKTNETKTNSENAKQ